MDPNPDKECENRGDIVLLSEIIAYSIYWQGIYSRDSVKFETNLRAYHQFHQSFDHLNISKFERYLVFWKKPSSLYLFRLHGLIN